MPSKIQQRLKDGKPLVIVELPGNSMELAQAAADAGADSIIAQLNNEHPVTHTYTGGLELEAAQIREMVSQLKVPLGLHLGSQSRITKDDWARISELGVDYIAASIVSLPPYILGLNSLNKIVYLPTGLPFEHYRSIGSFDSIVAVSFEALSQTQPDPQFRLNALDLLNLDTVSRLSPVPVLFRASQDVEEEDVRFIIERGCSGLIVDPAFTGPTPEHFRMTTEFYVKIVSASKPRPRFIGYSPWG
ncbi:MAG: hypothetical protein QXV32_07245 [Conexivisphaerales archaeon]